jgi:hypothetical protein
MSVEEITIDEYQTWHKIDKQRIANLVRVVELLEKENKERLAEKVEAKLAAVGPYLAHKPVCKWFDTSLNAVERSIACDCGLKEALK